VSPSWQEPIGFVTLVVATDRKGLGQLGSHRIAMNSAPICKECLEFKALFDKAMHAYIDGAKSLEGLPQGEEFELAYDSALSAVVAFNRIRELLNVHLVRHECTPIPAAS